jgi:hypothetical protein
MEYPWYYNISNWSGRRIGVIYGAESKILEYYNRLQVEIRWIRTICSLQPPVTPFRTSLWYHPQPNIYIGATSMSEAKRVLAAYQLTRVEIGDPELFEQIQVFDLDTVANMNDSDLS